MISGYHQVMFNAVLENACSEQGARMSAMDSSSRNAGEMLDRLTLTYNRSLSLSLPPSHVHAYTHKKKKYIYMAIVIGKRVVWHGFGKPAWSILC